MKKISKKRKEILSKVNLEKVYNLEEAIDVIKETPKANFDESVDLAINLSLNSSKSNNSVKGTTNLPHGVGKKLRIAVIAQGEKAEEAKKSGADVIGDVDLVKSIEQGKINFDRLISTPNMMKEVGKLGKVLGPKGLMPNPKLGTVTTDIAKAVKDAKEGQVQFKNDKAGIIHAGIGKVNFKKSMLIENIKVFFDAVSKTKPEGVKGNFIKRVSIATTMGSGIKLNLTELKKS